MILDDFRLDGKNALVTGSRTGLGAGIALALAEAGANVGCHGLTPEPNDICDEIRKAGPKTFFLHGDVSDPGLCSRLIQKTAEEFGYPSRTVESHTKTKARNSYHQEAGDNLNATTTGCNYQIAQVKPLTGHTSKRLPIRRGLFLFPTGEFGQTSSSRALPAEERAV